MEHGNRGFENWNGPVLDEFGLVKYYPESGALYKKGEPVYDRDGDYVTYRYEELLEMENRAAYHLNEREKLLDVGIRRMRRMTCR